MITYFRDGFMDDKDASVSVRSRALNYGLGCFGGIRGYASDDGSDLFIFRLSKHAERLAISAKTLCLPMRVSSARLEDIVCELLRKNDVHADCYVRPMVISDSDELSPVLREEDATLVVYTLPLARYIDKEALDVCVSSWRRTSDNAIPSRLKPTGGYINSALARREASDNGYDEAILLTERGQVSEGSAEHLFMVQGGELFSPPSTEDNLDGITRRSLIELATEDLGLKFRERPIGRTELYTADELFFCGTGAEIMPIASVDRRTIGDGKPGPISSQIKSHFADVVRGRVASRRSWLTPVWA
ncbi:MAG: branched-chain amino acid transaminase [Polyangiaceae bacterium]|nr:branched-chain amino acid transaminase [Polyangiaceae bacterium]